MQQTLSNEPGSTMYTLIRDEGDEVAYLRVVGEIDLSVEAKIEKALAALSTTAQATALDLSACRYIDSTIIAVMIRAYKRLGGKFFIILPLDHPLRRVFSVAGVLTTLPVRSE